MCSALLRQAVCLPLAFVDIAPVINVPQKGYKYCRRPIYGETFFCIDTETVDFKSQQKSKFTHVRGFSWDPMRHQMGLRTHSTLCILLIINTGRANMLI